MQSAHEDRETAIPNTGIQYLPGRVRSVLILVCLGILCSLACSGQANGEPRTFLIDHIGLTSQQILSIQQGKVVTKAISSRTPAELLVVGAVFVRARPEDYADLAFDMDRLRESSSYVAVGRFSDPPRLSDLDGFTFEPEDIRNLKSCRTGKCGVQMSDQMMLALQKGIDLEAPNARIEASQKMKQLAIEMLGRYRTEGNSALGIYQDKDYPFEVDAELRLMLKQVPLLQDYLPSLPEYLLDYPRAKLPNAKSFFFWEKVAFGLKPTLRLNHAISYRADSPRGTAHVVVVKQLYASHYLQLALDLTACVAGISNTGDPGFYLITFKASRQHGLTGFFGAIARTIIVSRTRAAQERILLNIKTKLESKR